MTSRFDVRETKAPTGDHIIPGKFPPTRYQGSKFKLIAWIEQCLGALSFDSALDLFGGTGSVSYLFKSMGKETHYNDVMPFNYHVGRALISNANVTICADELSAIFEERPGVQYPRFIEDNFQGIYYLDEENHLLDVAVTNIRSMQDEFKQSALWWMLGQACMSKRPYNLFHRANLYVRTANVKRSFGNKVTWDKSFRDHCEKFRKQFNLAVFDNHRANTVRCAAAIELDVSVDLVYMDPPYIPEVGTLTLYREFYHFLNGLIDYDAWGANIDYQSKHLKMKETPSPWEDRAQIIDQFKLVLEKHRHSILVISYRDDGIPSIRELTDFCEDLGKRVSIKKIEKQYALSKKHTKEVLIIAE